MRAVDSWRRRRAEPRLAWALARGAATAAARELNPTDPNSWEFCGFSQNGEDGIIDYLTRQLVAPTRQFLEIGAASGLDNNTAWLAVARRYQGVMIEGKASRAARARAVISKNTQGVEVIALQVHQDNVETVIVLAHGESPDVLSLDIDGIDYYVLQALLAAGLRPRIIVAEYNSTFGPVDAVTIPYTPDFDYRRAHASGLYYGVSVAALRSLLEPAGYRFVAVESNGVNAFFIDPAAFHARFVDELRPGLAFAENCTQRVRFREDWQAQRKRIAHLPVVTVGG